jgi:hypothetical protein
MSIISKISNFFTKNTSGKENNIRIRDYIAKRVKQKQTDIGESVAVEERRFVVKNSDVYMSIPLKNIITNDENIVVGDFNMEESLQFGKEWNEKRDTLKFDKDGMMILSPPESH